METINYTHYSYYELLQALNAIDKDRFPENYQSLIKELEARKASGNIETFDLKQKPYFGGFWRRVFAHIVDFLILSLPLLLIGYFMFDTFVALGNYGAIIGFILSAIYFTLGYSHVFGGQTAGKALVDIKVIDCQGGELSLSQAFIRYLILDFPYYLSPMLLLWFRPDSLMLFAITLLGMTVFFTSIYLLIFNRPSRRTVHDYIVGSMVINTDTDHQTYKPFWKGHYYIWSPIALILAVLSIGSFMSKQEVRESLHPIRQAIESQTDYQVRLLDVNEMPKPATKGASSKTLVVYVHTFDANMDLEAMSDEVIKTLKEHLDTPSFNNIYLVASTGFNLGIVYSTKKHTSFTQL